MLVSTKRHAAQVQSLRHPPKKMNLYLCTGTSPIGIFSDYVWASNRDQAVRKFYDAHGFMPNHIFLERSK